MTETGQSTEPPADPNAPTQHTLPSGKVVSVRSPRTLLGTDAGAAIGVQAGEGMQNVVDVHDALAALTVTELEPGNSTAPTLTAVTAPDSDPASMAAFRAAIDAVKAQRIDDWRRLYVLTAPAFNLVHGLANLIDYEEYADPKAPTKTSSEDSRSSEADTPQ